MIWLIYAICAVVILLAFVILVREIRKMIKGRCCGCDYDCKSCKKQETGAFRLTVNC